MNIACKFVAQIATPNLISISTNQFLSVQYGTLIKLSFRGYKVASNMSAPTTRTINIYASYAYQVGKTQSTWAYGIFKPSAAGGGGASEAPLGFWRITFFRYGFKGNTFRYS